MTPIRGRSARGIAHRIEPEHTDGAEVGRAVTLERLDGGRLARTVGSEQPEHLASGDVEGQIVDGGDAAVALHEPGNGDGRVGVSGGHGDSISEGGRTARYRSRHTT